MRHSVSKTGGPSSLGVRRPLLPLPRTPGQDSAGVRGFSPRLAPLVGHRCAAGGGRNGLERLLDRGSRRPGDARRRRLRHGDAAADLRLRPRRSLRRAPRGAQPHREETRCTGTSCRSWRAPSGSHARQRSCCSTRVARRASRPHAPSGSTLGLPRERTMSRRPVSAGGFWRMWRNWQTHRPQKPAGLSGEGSTPSVRTCSCARSSCPAWRQKHEQRERSCTLKTDIRGCA